MRGGEEIEGRRADAGGDFEKLRGQGGVVGLEEDGALACVGLRLVAMIMWRGVLGGGGYEFVEGVGLEGVDVEGESEDVFGDVEVTDVGRKAADY